MNLSTPVFIYNNGFSHVYKSIFNVICGLLSLGFYINVFINIFKFFTEDLKIYNQSFILIFLLYHIFGILFVFSLNLNLYYSLSIYFFSLLIICSILNLKYFLQKTVHNIYFMIIFNILLFIYLSLGILFLCIKQSYNLLYQIFKIDNVSFYNLNTQEQELLLSIYLLYPNEFLYLVNWFDPYLLQSVNYNKKKITIDLKFIFNILKLNTETPYENFLHFYNQSYNNNIQLFEL